MKKCELCKSAARIFCDSDQANLCWDCDSRVHSANFLVAKHSRTLLCQSCQSSTPWTGSGPKLGPTLSVCHPCCSRNSTDHHHLDDRASNDEDEDECENGEDEDEDEDESDHIADDDEDEDEDDGENQVVPYSASTPLHQQQQPPSFSSTTSSDDSSNRFYRDSDNSNNNNSNSNNRFLSKAADENGSFHYDGVERQEDKSNRRMRSWRWR